MSEDPQGGGRGGRGARERPSADPKRLEELKRQIEGGQYETEEKLAVTLRRMLAELRGLAAQKGASREDDSGGGPP